MNAFLKKRIGTTLKAVLLLTLAVLLTAGSGLALTGCSSKPTEEELYDRVAELLEGAGKVNYVFYGVGLPVYRQGSEYAEVRHLYYDFKYGTDYEYVAEATPFRSFEEIREATRKVYGSKLSEILFTHAFTGYAVSDGMGDAQYSYARYMEDSEWLYQSTSDKYVYYTGMLVYDYTTMRVDDPSNDEACYILIDCWDPETPEKKETRRIRLVFEEGNWYLDSFTG